MESIFLTTGKEVALFEEKFAGYLGQKFALGLMSGTAALHLALLALGIGPEDEVITTPMTFVATALAIMHTGARPVFVDVEPETGNLDAKLVAQAINAKTKAILPVHLYGQMVDMHHLKEMARAHDLVIIEDAAHCLEGERDGIRVGELADAACFSFYPTKSITCGEGGAVSSNHEFLLEPLKKLRMHGMSTHAEDRYTARYRHYDVDVEGWKYNMSNLQAALLIDQIEEIEPVARNGSVWPTIIVIVSLTSPVSIFRCSCRVSSRDTTFLPFGYPLKSVIQFYGSYSKMASAWRLTTAPVICIQSSGISTAIKKVICPRQNISGLELLACPFIPVFVRPR